jgi:hypothetical protein
MARLSDLIDRVRTELADTPKYFSKTIDTVDGVRADFDLNVKPLDRYNVQVYVNGEPYTQPDMFTLEAGKGIIHFVNAPLTTDFVEITGWHWRYFTEEEIINFVGIAVTQHTNNRTNEFGEKYNLRSIDLVEVYPVTILAVIEALWALATDSSFDIDIQAPDGVSIPRGQRYQQITDLIGKRWDQYKQLCAQLNIGLFRIEMGTLRRVSRTTNKLVPIYVSQEIDDSSKPERVYIVNDLTGREPVPSAVPVHDLRIYQGDSFALNIYLGFDITGLTVKAQIRSYPNSPTVYATFDYTVYDAMTGKITLLLTKNDTVNLPVRTFWDLQITDPLDANYEQTVRKGQIFATQQITMD